MSILIRYSHKYRYYSLTNIRVLGRPVHVTTRYQRGRSSPAPAYTYMRPRDLGLEPSQFRSLSFKFE
jgi:hypothetical protein